MTARHNFPHFSNRTLPLAESESRKDALEHACFFFLPDQNRAFAHLHLPFPLDFFFLETPARLGSSYFLSPCHPLLATAVFVSPCRVCITFPFSASVPRK
jgi:hypothetical protein